MNSLIRRLLVDAREVSYRLISLNPKEGYCCAHIKLGRHFPSRIHCSFRARLDSAFCGQHDHLNAVVGMDVEEWLASHGLTLEDALRRSFSPNTRTLSLEGTLKRRAGNGVVR
jgi:hypothetical protein